jgi:histidinol-phosphatase (PHP family)
MKLFNLHTHTNYCDGSESPETYVKKAIKLGFQSLGFSGHAPLPFKNTFAIANDELNFYVMEIRDLQEQYKDEIEIYLSLEFDYIPNMLDDFSIYQNQLALDYIIGSIHLVRNAENGKLWFTDGSRQSTYDKGLKEVFNNDIQKAVTAFYAQTNQMIETQKPDIIGHLDKIKMHNKDRFFREDEGWYIKLVNESLNLAKANDCIIEVNTRGLYKKRCDTFFPETAILKKIKSLNIPITISSDAHKPEDLNQYLAEALNTLKELGFKEIMKLQKGEWITVKL